MNYIEQVIQEAGQDINLVGYKDLQRLFSESVQGLHNLTHSDSLVAGVAKSIQIPENIRVAAIQLLQNPYLRGVLVGAWSKCNGARLILDKDSAHVVITIGD